MDGVWEWRRMERIQYQHADAKMQMRGWMNAVYGKCGVRLFSVARQKKRDAQEVKNAGLPKIAEVLPVQYGPLGARGAESCNRTSLRLLHVDKEVSFEDVLPFLVLLGLFVRLVLLN